MKATDLERHRQQLLALVQRLRAEVADMRDAALRATANHASIGNTESVPGDSADMSADEAQLDIDISLHENERQIFNQADEALERIKAGSYGRCLECGKPIAEERLEAIPYTPHCLDCARREQDQEGTGATAGSPV